MSMMRQYSVIEMKWGKSNIPPVCYLTPLVLKRDLTFCSSSALFIGLEKASRGSIKYKCICVGVKISVLLICNLHKLQRQGQMWDIKSQGCLSLLMKKQAAKLKWRIETSTLWCAGTLHLMGRMRGESQQRKSQTVQEHHLLTGDIVNTALNPLINKSSIKPLTCVAPLLKNHNFNTSYLLVISGSTRRTTHFIKDKSHPE